MSTMLVAVTCGVSIAAAIGGYIAGRWGSPINSDRQAPLRRALIAEDQVKFAQKEIAQLREVNSNLTAEAERLGAIAASHDVKLAEGVVVVFREVWDDRRYTFPLHQVCEKLRRDVATFDGKRIRLYSDIDSTVSAFVDRKRACWNSARVDVDVEGVAEEAVASFVSWLDTYKMFDGWRTWHHAVTCTISCSICEERCPIETPHIVEVAVVTEKVVEKVVEVPRYIDLAREQIVDVAPTAASATEDIDERVRAIVEVELAEATARRAAGAMNGHHAES